MALLSSETVIGRFTSNRDALVRVVRRRLLITPAIVLGVMVPFLLLIILSGPVTLKTVLVGVVPITLIFALLLAVFTLSLRRLEKKAPSVLSVTNRRVVVEHFGKNEGMTQMMMENVGSVQTESKGYAQTLGVAWLFVLPMGSSSVYVRAGKYRMIAPGVLWMPALPINQVQQVQQLVNEESTRVKFALGFPAPS